MQGITKHSVQSSYHGFKIQSANINDDKTLQILHLLGGIDHVLELFLCNDNIQMNQTQLNQLNHLFITPQVTVPQVNHISASDDANNETHNIRNKMRHTLDVSNTYLQSIWGETIAVDVTKMIHSKCAHLLFVLVTIVTVIFRFKVPDDIIYTMYYLIVGIAGHCYFMMWLLSANKTATHLVIRTFEFWLKFGAVILLISLKFISTYIYGARIRGNELRAIADLILYSNIMLFVVILSLFDALNINRVSKLFFSGTFTIAATILLIYQNYVYYFNGSESIVNVNVTDNVSLSLISMENNAMEVLVLFYWKQLIMTIYKKDQCVLIKYSPYIEWISRPHDPITTHNDMTYGHDEDDDEKAIPTNRSHIENQTSMAINYTEYDDNDEMNEEQQDMKRIPTTRTDLKQMQEDKSDDSESDLTAHNQE